MQSDDALIIHPSIYKTLQESIVPRIVAVADHAIFWKKNRKIGLFDYYDLLEYRRDQRGGLLNLHLYHWINGILSREVVSRFSSSLSGGIYTTCRDCARCVMHKSKLHEIRKEITGIRVIRKRLSSISRIIQKEPFLGGCFHCYFE